MTPIPCPVPGPAQCEFIRVEQVASSSRRFNPAYLAAALPAIGIPFLLFGGGGGSGASVTPDAPVPPVGPGTPSTPIVLSPPIPQPSVQPSPGPSSQPSPQPIPEQGYGFAALAAGVIFWGLKHRRADFAEAVNRNKSTFALLPLFAATSVFAGTVVPPTQPVPASVLVTKLGNSIQVMHEGKLLTLPAPAGLPADLASYKFTLKAADGGWELCWQELEKPCPKASPITPAPRVRPVEPTPSRIMW